jgi:hypothetical protein
MPNQPLLRADAPGVSDHLGRVGRGAFGELGVERLRLPRDAGLRPSAVHLPLGPARLALSSGRTAQRF